MGLSDNPFIGLSVPDLTELQASCQQMIRDIMVGGQSYTFQGRTFTRANLREAKDTLFQITQAKNSANGTGRTIAQARTYHRGGGCE